MPQLSATTLKLFQECPRCFWLHVNKKVERPRGPFPSLPSGIDRVLKGYFEGYRQQKLLPPLVRGKLDGVLADAALTLGFNDGASGARLWGKLDDCVILPDGRHAPLDHKTRASAPDDVSYTQQYYQFQMDVYTLLLERNGYPTTRNAYVVYYFPQDGSLHDGFPFGVAVHKVQTDPEGAYRIFTEGCACLASPLPASGPACAYCRWLDTRTGFAGSPLAGGAAPQLAPPVQPMSAPPSTSPPQVAPPLPVTPPRAALRPAGKSQSFPEDLFA